MAAPSREEMKKSMLLVHSGLLGVFIALVGRLAWIQLYDHDYFAALASESHRGVAKLPAKRGPILDRCDRVLAESVWVKSLSADPTIVARPAEAAFLIAAALNLNPYEVYEKLTRRRRRFVWIKRFLTDQELRSVEGLKESYRLRGVFLTRETRRVYPLGRVAAHVVGFCSLDGEGLAGVELVCNRRLAGEDGYRRVFRDGRRRGMAMPGMPVKPPRDGDAVVLTIDSVIQTIAYEEVSKAKAENGAKAAVGMVLDCRTGEVLAMVSLPTFCPDRWAKGPGINPKRFTPECADIRRNRAVADLYEPGSIFKPFVASGAFETGAVSPDDEFNCHNGSYRLGRRVLHDAHGYGVMTAHMIIVKSSNIGMAQVAAKAGPQVVYRYLRAFGFGDTTHFDLPGEPRGVLRPPERWRPDYSLPSIAMGQEVSASPLRLAVSFCAFGNGGYVPRPHVLKEFIDSRTGEVRRAPSAKISLRRVLKPETCTKIFWPILKDIVEFGTGRYAKQKGYVLGGKTGTAQMLREDGKGYAEKSFFSSFLCLAPMEAPRICVAVMMVKPRVDAKKTYYGGRASAPAAGRIAKRTLMYLGVKPHLEITAVEAAAPRTKHFSHAAAGAAAPAHPS